MANPSEDQIEQVSQEELVVEEKQEDSAGMVAEVQDAATERSQEIPALLETDPPQEDHVESEQQEQDESEQSEILSPSPVQEDDTANCAVNLADNQSDERTVSIQYIESPTTSQELNAIRNELKSMFESMQAFQSATEQITAKVDGVAAESAAMSGKINEIALNHELISSELESLVSGAGSRNVLSKAFMICVCVVLIALAGFQIYTFMSLVQTDNLQTASGTKLIENLNGLNKKMAEYNANLTKSMTAPEPHANAQSQHAPATEAAGHEAAPQHTPEAPAAIPLSEKLNRLRNGAVEKKLVRKETGDWFVYTKKIDECIADVEIISALNQAYRRLGRPLPNSVQTPSHNSLCILKPDGKGGTEIVMTQNFVP